MEAGEGLQPVQRAGGLEGLGVELQRRRRGVAAGAAGRLLGRWVDNRLAARIRNATCGPGSVEDVGGGLGDERAVDPAVGKVGLFAGP